MNEQLIAQMVATGMTREQAIQILLAGNASQTAVATVSDPNTNTNALTARITANRALFAPNLVNATFSSIRVVGQQGSDSAILGILGYGLSATDCALFEQNLNAAIASGKMSVVDVFVKTVKERKRDDGTIEVPFSVTPSIRISGQMLGKDGTAKTVKLPIGFKSKVALTSDADMERFLNNCAAIGAIGEVLSGVSIEHTWFNTDTNSTISVKTSIACAI